MLQVFRNSAKGTVGKVIVGLIVITFVLFGAESIISIAGNTAPATVNGDDISELDYQRLLNSRQQELTNQFGAEVASQLVNSPYLREEVVNSLINQKLQSQLTQDLKFETSEEQVLKTFSDIAAFQIDGKFDQDMYQNALSANGFNHQSFIAIQKAQSALNQMQAGVVNSAFVVKPTVERYAALDAQQRKIAYRAFNASDYIDEVVVTDDELQDYYVENETQFLSEEKVKVNYLRLTLADLAADVLVTDAELDASYQSYVAELVAKETREVSHILFADGDDNKIEALTALDRIKAGESFADLAIELSDDPGSAEFGGSLGALIPDVYVTEFYDAAMALTSEGEVSQLVETQYGVHLIKLDSLSTSQAVSLEEKSQELTAVIKDRKARDEMLLVESQLADEAFAKDTLAEVAESFQTTVVESDWLTRTSSNELMVDAGVSEAVFSSQVIDEGLISNVVRLPGGDLITVQKVGYEPESVKSFDSVKSEIVQALTEIKASELMAVRLSEAVAGSSEINEDWSEVATIGRTNSELPPEVVQKAFELPAAVLEGYSFGKTDGAETAYAVAVLEVIPAKASDAQLASAETTAAQMSGGAQYQMLFNKARNEAKIKIRQ